MFDRKPRAKLGVMLSRSDAKAQPFEVLADLLGDFTANAGHEEVFRFQADVRFVGGKFRKPLGAEETDQDIAVLLGGQARALQIPCPGIAHHVGDHGFDGRVSYHLAEHVGGQMECPIAPAHLHDLDLQHDAMPQFKPAFVGIRWTEDPETDDLEIVRQSEHHIGVGKSGMCLKGFAFGVERFVLGVKAELLIEATTLDHFGRQEGLNGDRTGRCLPVNRLG